MPHPFLRIRPSMFSLPSFTRGCCLDPVRLLGCRGRHAFHNYTVRRIYRPEEGRSRSTQRQWQYSSAETPRSDKRGGARRGQARVRVAW